MTCLSLENSPSNFQRIMYDLLVHNRWQWYLVYLDDILIFSDSFQEHKQYLHEIRIGSASGNKSSGEYVKLLIFQRIDRISGTYD